MTQVDGVDMHRNIEAARSRHTRWCLTCWVSDITWWISPRLWRWWHRV